MWFKIFVSLLFTVIFAAIVADAFSDRVLLRDIQALTLRQGEYTRAGRQRPIPQLQCVGGSAQYSSYQPTVVQCRNVGWDGNDVQWECKAELDEAVKFGALNVNCEGYQYPDDPYVLRGSCGLEYTLDYTRKGDNQRRAEYSESRPQYHSYTSTSYEKASSFSGFTWLLTAFLIVGVIYFVLKVLCGSVSADPTQSPASRPGGYGVPPAYDVPHAGYPYGHQSQYGDSYGGYIPSSSAQAPRPGFWSGFTTGGLLGYFMRPRGYGSNHGPSYSPTYPRTYGSPSMPVSSSRSNEGGSRTASGFGGTKRR